MAGGGSSQPSSPPLNALKSNAMNYPYMRTNIALARGDDVANVSAENITDSEALEHCGSPVLLLSFYFDADELHLTDHALDLVFEGTTYSATGDLLKVQNRKSSTAINAEGCTFTLSGQNSALVSLMPSAEEWLDRDVKMHVAFISDTSEVLSKFDVFEGYMLAPSTKKDPKSGTFTISLKTKSVWDRLDKVPGNLSADAVQQALFPGDRAFEYTSMVDYETKWKQKE